MSTRKQNQQNPPLPKKKRMDAEGNDHRRLFCKSGNATLMIASHLTSNSADVAIQEIINTVEILGGKIECSFIVCKQYEHNLS